MVQSARGLPGVEELSARIHNTLVSPEATWNDVERFCMESADFGAVVVQACWASDVKRLLKKTPVSVGVGFPMGGSTTESKVTDVAEAVRCGADSFEFMPNMGFLKSRLDAKFEDEIERVVKAADGRPVRAILEFAVLTSEEKVRAARLSERAGVDTVKNSSGWGRGGPATVEDIALLRRTVSPKVHVKASGGIRNLETSLTLVEAGADYLGTRAGLAIIEELKVRLGK
ncbi:MAG: deoxyribose-phosphate aldolase [Nitrososphaerota archaeon]|nr:deoxyribose-phosphate aldolase [Nitrososphaerota archaeon]